MKKLLFILILTGFIFSCSKDNDPLDYGIPDNTNSLKGTGTLPFNVSLVSISFDYDHANNTEDGIDIRQNWNVDILGDYNTSSGKNDPFAYRMGKNNVKVRVFISATNADLSWNNVLNIEGRLKRGREIGNFRGTITLSSRGSSVSYGNGILTADGSVAPNVGINDTLAWEWHVTGWNNNACDYAFATSGPHKLYRLYDIPTAPWYFSGDPLYGDPKVAINGNWVPSTDKRGKEPHIDNVLANACLWAKGLSSAEEIVKKITTSTYEDFESNGVQYDPISFTYAPYQRPENMWYANPVPVYFHMVNVPYFNNGGGLIRANCNVASDYVQILTRALGISTKIIQLHKSNFTNYTTSPCRPFNGGITYVQRSFAYHQVVYYNGKIFDPTAKFANNGYNLITGASIDEYVIKAVASGQIITWSPACNIESIGWYY